VHKDLKEILVSLGLWVLKGHKVILDILGHKVILVLWVFQVPQASQVQQVLKELLDTQVL
jgi:hypothetical protein